MKRSITFLLAAFLAGCAGYGYPVREGGDGVYYAESPPVYTYVNGYFGFPYYGPWDWSWYYPVWYSPMAGQHYSWYRPRSFWADPVYRPAGGLVNYHPPRRKVPSAPGPVDDKLKPRPIMPVDLQRAVVSPTLPGPHGKSVTFPSSKTKDRALAKKNQTAVPSRSYGANKPVSPSAKSAPSYSPPPRARAPRHAPPPRPPSSRRPSENRD